MDMLRAMLRDYGSQSAPDQSPLDTERINKAAGGWTTQTADNQTRPMQPPPLSPDDTGYTGAAHYTIPEAPGSSYGSIPELLAAQAKLQQAQQQNTDRTGFEQLIDKLQSLGGRVGDANPPPPSSVNWR